MEEDHSLSKVRYKAELTNLVKRGLHITEGNTVFGMGDTRWSYLLHYFAVKAAERKFAEKEAVEVFGKPGNVKAAFIDVANVILFDDIGRVARGLADHCDMTEEEIFQIMEPKEFWIDIDRGEISTEDYFERVKKRLGLRLDYEAFSKIWIDRYKVNPEAVEAIRQLKKAGYKIYIVSNCCKAHREYYCKKYDYIFKMTDDFIASYEEGIMKPDKKIFEKALAVAGLKLQEVVFVDDSEENAEGALSPGIVSMRYISGRTDLQSELANLIALLNRLPKERLTGQQSTLRMYKVIAAFSTAA